jgi:multiple antibiotic resistance protein
MIASGVLAFTTLFATVGPIDVAAVFAALTAHAHAEQRRRMAAKAALVATAILLVIALVGSDLLHWLGVGLPALRLAGGVLLLLVAVDMVFARHSGVTSPTPEESEEAEARADISVFPIATPLIAGPGAIGAIILRMAEARGDIRLQAAVIAALFAVMALTYAALVAAGAMSRLLGVTGLNAITRVLGVLLAALSVQFMIDGLIAAGLMR